MGESKQTHIRVLRLLFRGERNQLSAGRFYFSEEANVSGLQRKTIVMQFVIEVLRQTGDKYKAVLLAFISECTHFTEFFATLPAALGACCCWSPGGLATCGSFLPLPCSTSFFCSFFVSYHASTLRSLARATAPSFSFACMRSHFFAQLREGMFELSLFAERILTCFRVRSPHLSHRMSRRYFVHRCHFSTLC